MKIGYWNDTVTVMKPDGETVVAEDCFWRRRTRFVYDGGRRREEDLFLCRVPGEADIRPGDILALGAVEAENAEAYLTEHPESCFRAAKVSYGKRGARCEGASL